MGKQILDGALFEEMVKAGAANLYAFREAVNDLNVFPIPDGDTGDNMYLTIDSGASSASGGKAALGAAASRMAKGMLLGARGNSGVILSRIFAGIASGFDGAETADLQAVAEAFRQGSKEAYNAVSNPVEGTILTVFRDAVDFAGGRVGGESDLDTYFDDLIAELRRSLERTPDLLDVLREAGVVDSGGAGLVYIAEGMKNGLDGVSFTSAGKAVDKAAKPIDIDTFTEDTELEFGYCTEVLIRLQNKKTDIANFDINDFKAKLEAIGESVVAFVDGSIVKVHIHTMTPGQILDFCQRYGEFLTLKIENMMLQHNETTIENKTEFKRKKVHKRVGIIAVASGDGIKETFSSLGVDEIIDGGQSMNPSSGDIIAAAEKIDADYILVYPNNGNIIMAANQAAALYDKAELKVIKTRTIGEGYASLSMLDVTGDDIDRIVSDAESYADGVLTGMVSKAARTTEMNGVSIIEGDYIGFEGDTVYSDSPDKCAAAIGLAEKLGAGDYDVILILAGADAADEEAVKVKTAYEERFEDSEVILMKGGQPLHDFIIIIE
ncbi:MAG: DAK2 domain-containing protein [Clostridia bacterium]|nr:DAK2 domain-containing protein [Clostridia bacterium]